MKFSFDAKPFFFRLLVNLKGHFIFFSVIIGLDFLLTNSIGFFTLAGFIGVCYALIISMLRYNKFYIETLIMDETTLRMKVYRFNKLFLDTNQVFDLKEVKMENIASSSSYIQKDSILKISVSDLKFWQLDINGWKKENFDEIISFLHDHK